MLTGVVCVGGGKMNQMDLRTQAQEIVGEAVRRAEAGFEAVMADTGQA